MEKTKEMATQSNYTADNIQALKGLEPVRTRPAMYIGDTSVKGLHHLVYEVVDNSIDEAMAGYCDTIEVTIHSDGSLSVLDNGRGIPVDIHKDYGVPAVEVVLTVLHAGGKFDNNTYKVSGGLHGVGVSCVNALSKWLEVEVYRDGKTYRQSFRRGKKDSDLQVVGPTDLRGTKITFKPDSEIFETTTFDYNILAKRLRELAFLNKGVSISLEDKRTGKKEVFCYEGGIVSFVEYLNANKKPIHSDIVYFEKQEEKIFVELAFQYTEDYAENIHSFANNINTREGGTHLSGFKSALTGTLNRYGKSHNILKDMTLSGEDCREGLSAIISVKIPNPQFEGQTKTKLGNREVQGMVESIVNEYLGRYLEENPTVAKTIIQRSLNAAKAREAAKKARDLARRKNALNSNSLPGKLADCTSQNVEETELYIVEGESAGGSAKQGRNRHFQAILPLKGKILNVEKANPLKMLKHSEIQTIITALGTGINEDFDLAKTRYGKIIIMTDADVDGHHIRTLLLTFFYRYMPKLIEHGRVYIANPPLYKVTRKKFEKYYHSDEEIRRDLMEYSLGQSALIHIDRHTKIEGEELKQLLNIGEIMESQIYDLREKGVDLEQYFESWKIRGLMPKYAAKFNGDLEFFSTEEELNQFLKSHALSGEGEGEDTEKDSSTSEKKYQILEFHEAPDFEEALEKLLQMGFPKEEVLEVLQEDRKIFQIQFGGKIVEGEFGFLGLSEEILKLAQKSQNIQRFKGLGEMNPEQLWETTMNPETRTLYRVKLEDTIEPDKIFTILMGSEVEPRRDFIEKHALDVKMLDV